MELVLEEYKNDHQLINNHLQMLEPLLHHSSHFQLNSIFLDPNELDCQQTHFRQHLKMNHQPIYDRLFLELC